MSQSHPKGDFRSRSVRTRVGRSCRRASTRRLVLILIDAGRERHGPRRDSLRWALGVPLLTPSRELLHHFKLLLLLLHQHRGHLRVAFGGGGETRRGRRGRGRRRGAGTVARRAGARLRAQRQTEQLAPERARERREPGGGHDAGAGRARCPLLLLSPSRGPLLLRVPAGADLRVRLERVGVLLLLEAERAQVFAEPLELRGRGRLEHVERRYTAAPPPLHTHCGVREAHWHQPLRVNHRNLECSNVR